MSEKQEPSGEQEEDLLADFRDVLGSDDSAAAGKAGEDDSMAELDAFLNEFGKGGGSAADDAPAGDVPELHVEEFGGDEVVPELHAEEFGGDEVVPELHAEEFGGDEVVPELHAEEFGGDEVVPELHVEEFGGDETPPPAPGPITDESIPALLHGEEPALPDELNLDVAPEPAAASEADVMDDLFDRPITATPSSAYVDEEDDLIADETPAPRAAGLDISSVGVALFSLVIAAVVGWFAVTLHVEMGDMRAELAQLRQQSAPAAAVGLPSAQVEQELGRLNQRLNDMAANMDGRLNDASRRELDTVSRRLDELSQTVDTLRTELSRQEQSTAAAKPAPQQSAAKAAAPRPAPAKTASRPRRGNWVVNVASLTDAVSAAAEQKRLKQAGIDTEVQKAVMDGHTWYRVRVTGFASREEAQVYADMAKTKLEGSPWVGQQ